MKTRLFLFIAVVLGAAALSSHSFIASAQSEAPVVLDGSSPFSVQDGCFIAGTKILMADRTHKAIEKVRKGDKVQGLDRSNSVDNTMVIKYKGWLYSFNGGKYFVTEAHPFMTKGGIWKAFNPEAAMKENPGLDIKQLKVGDVLIGRQAPVTLEKVDRVWKKRKVYNFVVNNAHDYYADGYLVHNKQADPACAQQ
jgi:hypothetical protein